MFHLSSSFYDENEGLVVIWGALQLECSLLSVDLWEWLYSPCLLARPFPSLERRNTLLFQAVRPKLSILEWIFLNAVKTQVATLLFYKITQCWWDQWRPHHHWLSCSLFSMLITHEAYISCKEYVLKIIFWCWLRKTISTLTAWWKLFL